MRKKRYCVCVFKCVFACLGWGPWGVCRVWGGCRLECCRHSFSISVLHTHTQCGLISYYMLCSSVISRAPGLKLVVETLMSSLKPIGNIVVICCAFFIIFGILGVQVRRGWRDTDRNNDKAKMLDDGITPVTCDKFPHSSSLSLALPCAYIRKIAFSCTHHNISHTPGHLCTLIWLQLTFHGYQPKDQSIAMSSVPLVQFWLQFICHEHVDVHKPSVHAKYCHEGLNQGLIFSFASLYMISFRTLYIVLKLLSTAFGSPLKVIPLTSTLITTQAKDTHGIINIWCKKWHIWY